MSSEAGPAGRRVISRQVAARRVALALALLGLAWAILLIWTGGFDTAIGGIPVTAHEPRRPLWIVAIAGAVWAALGGHLTLSMLWTAVCARVSARALAVVFTLAVVATGLRFSSTVGGGSDSYGYVSQADLWLKGQLRTPQPFAKEAPWPTPRWTFAPLAYVPGDDDYDLVPRYSAGLPLLMALGKLIAGQPGIFFVVPLSSGVLVLATFLIGRRMGLERTGVIAAFLVASSPVVLYMTSAVMSDVPVAAAWAVAMWCLFGTSRTAAIGCGIAASIAILIRPNLVPQAGVCVAWYVWQAWRASGSDRRARLGQFALFVLALVPGIAGVAMINASFYGSPAKSGYGPLQYLYGWSNIWPNLRVYTAWLIQSQTIVVFAGLAAVLLPIGWLWRGARDRAMVVALALFVLGMWAQYCVYGVFDAWWYLRFLLPCWPMMMIGLARLVDVLGGRWTPAVRFVAVGLVLAIGIRWVTFANANFAFDMRRGEWKYAAVSRAVQQRSDRNSLVFSMLYSGTVRYYGGRMSLTYPALERDWLDRAIAWCREHDIHPYALLEDWEIKEFRETFATQAAGALAGPPLFVYHGPSTVYFFDLAPSEAPPATEHMTETYRDISYALPAPPPRLEDPMTAAPPRETRAWAVASAIYAVLAVIYCWPVLREIGAVLPNDTGDPGLNSWIMWWNTQAMPLTDRWWNAPMFFPMPGAFALSETLLSLAPISTPLLWMGVSPVVVHNVLYFLSFPTAALAAHALARRLTGRHDAALLAGLAFGFNPYRAAQMPHLQMMVTCWMPLMLLALHRYLDERRPRYLVLAGFCWLMNALTSGYLLVFFAVLAGLWIVWFVRTRADLIRIGAALAIASLPLVPLLAAYRHWQTALGASRTLGEIEEFSADLKAIWAASERSWLASHFTVLPDPEGELYPGVIILGLTILGGVLAWRKTTGGNLRKLRATLVILGIITAAVAIAAARAGGWQFQLVGIPVSMTRPFKVMTTAVWLLGAALVLDRRFIDGWRRRSVFMFYGLAAAAMFVLALGPIARVFGERFWYAAPYYWLTQMPGGGSLRVPARFAMLMALCLSQSAAIVFSRLTVPGRARALAAVLAAGIALDGLPSMDIGRVSQPLDLSGLDRNAVVFELPSTNLYDQTTALLHATTHGRTLINGYSGYDPQHFWLLNLALRDLDPSAIEVMTRYRTMLVVVNRENDIEGKVDALVRQIPGAQLVRNSAQGPIYQLPVRPIPVTDFGAPLKIGELSVTQNAATARYADDGAFDTRWEDPADGAPGEMTIDLERPAAITRIELDIAQWRLDYPRRLRIAVAAPGADPVTVWEGRTAGLAVVAALDDLNRMPIRIDLPPGTTGQRVVLTLLEEHKELSWSVAEIRIWGK